MALVRWLGERDLWNRMTRMQRELERNWPFSSSSPFTMAEYSSRVFPPLNIYDDGESLIVRSEMPGVEPKSLDITATGDTLTIRGKRTIESADEKCCYHRRERSHGEFRRAFTLPDRVDSNKITASFNNGVLSVLLPRAEQARQHKITVKTS